jgi:hypothetical protein
MRAGGTNRGNQSREFIATWQLKLLCPDPELTNFGGWIVENHARFDSEGRNRSETINSVIESRRRDLRLGRGCPFASIDFGHLCHVSSQPDQARKPAKRQTT